MKHSERVVVFLTAERCVNGVMPAIQAKLQGSITRDEKYLRNLIYMGAIDIYIDGLNEVSADTRARITRFIEEFFRSNIIIATQPIEWIAPAIAEIYELQPLRDDQVSGFLLRQEAAFPADAPIRGEDYRSECETYLEKTLGQGQDKESLIAARRILSNPMDLALVACMISRDKSPDIFQLREQQYLLMTADYEHIHPGKHFPIEEFSETIYQMRINDQAVIPHHHFSDEVTCMDRHKMVLRRQFRNLDGKQIQEWYFRHDKIMEYFIVRTFLGESDRPRKHFGEARFRGVYFLLATLLDYEDALALRDQLMLYAAETKDHTVSDTFIQLVHSRQEKLTC